jgi:hypothetical protein
MTLEDLSVIPETSMMSNPVVALPSVLEIRIGLTGGAFYSKSVLLERTDRVN